MYNYFYWACIDDNKKNVNNRNYYNACLSDLSMLENVKIIYYPLQNRNYIWRYLYSIHNSRRLNSKVNVPFKSLWYKYVIDKKAIKKDEDNCFVFTGYNVDYKYVYYLKKRYPNARFVFVIRDKVEMYLKKVPIFMKKVLEDNLFEYIFSYDEIDCDKYGFIHFDEISSKISLEKSLIEEKYDVFFAGIVKDRYNLLIDIYKFLTQYGIRVNYYLVGVEKNKRISYPGIEYADKSLDYYEMLSRTLQAKCILEINQKNASGYTSRVLEAITYDKKLISNNLNIRNNRFFDTRFICLFESVNEISIDFIKNNDLVTFNYKNEFSPVKLIELIEKTLNKSC